jgi:NTP pyrophosphatase (non-canonical NTP hydrolase)
MQTEHYIYQQNENRRVWGEHDTPESIVEMMAHETAELAESIQEAYITGDVFSVVSEIGDVGYLLYRLCLELGIDLDEAVETKISRNSMKYPDYIMSNERSHEQAVRVAREGWRAMGGDPAWSHAFLNHYAHLGE